MTEQVLRLGIDARDMQSGERVATRSLKDIKRDANSATGAVQKTEGAFSRFKKQLVGFGAVAGALGLGLLVRSIIKIGSAFEQLRVQLKTVTGSAEAAAKQFKVIQGLASKTPFAVRNLTEAYINLKGVGLKPAKEEMIALADLAAGRGRDITQAVQAAVSASFGEAEALKQFGIILRSEGDQAKISFNGVTKSIKKDASSIFQAIIEIAQANFGGAAEDQSRTFAGAMSNMGDAFDKFSDRVASTGALGALTQGILNATSLIGLMGDNLDTLGSIATVVATILGVRLVQALGAAAWAAFLTQNLAAVAGIRMMATIAPIAAARMALMTGAATALRGALAFVGGPIGLAITGLAIAFVTLSEDVLSASEAMKVAKTASDDWFSGIDGQIEKIDKLSTAERKLAEGRLINARDQLKLSIDENTSSLATRVFRGLNGKMGIGDDNFEGLINQFQNFTFGDDRLGVEKLKQQFIGAKVSANELGVALASISKFEGQTGLLPKVMAKATELQSLRDGLSAIEAQIASINGTATAQQKILASVGVQIEGNTGETSNTNTEAAKGVDILGILLKLTADRLKIQRKQRAVFADTTGDLDLELKVQKLILAGRDEEADTVAYIAALSGRMGRELLPAELDQIHQKLSLLQGVRKEIGAQRDAVDGVSQAWDQAYRNIQDSFGQLFQDIFDNGLNGFKGFAKNVFGIFKTMAAQIAGAKLFDAIFKTASPEGGIGGIANIIGGSSENKSTADSGKDGKGIFGSGFELKLPTEGILTKIDFGPLKGLFSGLSKGLKGITGKLGGLLGNIGFGQALGGLGLSGTGGSIGAVIGSAIPGLGNILGGIAGGIIGKLVGLFGKTAKAGATVGVGSSGELGVTGSFARGKGDRAVAGTLADSVIDILNKIADGAGGSLQAGFQVGQIGHRKDEFVFQSTPSRDNKNFGSNDRHQTFDNAEDAVAAAVASALSRGVITGLSDISKNLLKNANINDLDSVLQDVAFVEGAHKDLMSRLVDFTNPAKAAWEELVSTQETEFNKFRKFGLDTNLLLEVQGKERERLLKSQSEALTRDWKNFLFELQFGSLSFRSGSNVVGDLLSEFAVFEARLGAGENVDFGAFQQVGRTIIEQARNIFASSSDFFSIQQRVQDATNLAILNQNDRLDALDQPDFGQVSDSVNMQTDVIDAIGQETIDVLNDLRNGITGISVAINAQTNAINQMAGTGGGYRGTERTASFN